LSLPVYIYSYCDYIQIGPGGKSLLQAAMASPPPGTAGHCATRREHRSAFWRPRSARVYAAQVCATHTSTTGSAIKNS